MFKSFQAYFVWPELFRHKKKNTQGKQIIDQYPQWILTKKTLNNDNNKSAE